MWLSHRKNGRFGIIMQLSVRWESDVRYIFGHQPVERPNCLRPVEISQVAGCPNQKMKVGIGNATVCHFP